jgi:hypothetical protein
MLAPGATTEVTFVVDTTALGPGRYTHTVTTANDSASGTLQVLEPNSKIENWSDLDAVRNDLDGDYVLVNNLDETTAGYDKFVRDRNKGWEPIGEPGNPFVGSLDGQGKILEDVIIDSPNTNQVGVFGVTDDANIRNISIVDVEITGGRDVGGIVGNQIGGEISNSRVTGNVQGTVSTLTNVGGIAGEVSGKITKSSAEINVTGEDRVGGIVGWFITGEVTYSYAEGNVNGETSVGGLIGDNGADITNSYSRADVSGEMSVGGLVGFNDGMKITNSYAAGKITARGGGAGLVGRHFGIENRSQIIDSYWDVEATGTDRGVGIRENGGEINISGLESSEMKGERAKQNMPSLNFEQDWKSVTSPDDYPTLQWESTTSPLTG